MEEGGNEWNNVFNKNSKVIEYEVRLASCYIALSLIPILY